MDWSRDNSDFSVKQLTERLIDVIRLEGTRGKEIPKHPPVTTPLRVDLVAFGTRTKDVDALDEKYLGDERKLRKKARKLLKERESRGEGSLTHECQPPKPKTIHDVVGKRIEVLTSVKVGSNETTLIWWAGMVKYVVSERMREVMIEWDALEYVKGWEHGGECKQKLASTKWRKNIENAWRMEFVDPCSDSDSDNEDDN